MSYEELLLDKKDGIATITLNRPEKRNAFDPQGSLILDLPAAIEEVRRDESMRVIVLTGAGSCFCAGGDLKSMIKRHGEHSAIGTTQQLRDSVQKIPIAFRRCGKPVIAAVNGPALGAGLDLSLMADIRFAADTAIFSQGYVKMGLVPGAGGAYLLPRAVGLSKACEMLFTGDTIDAQEALRIGLVSKVVPAAELMPAVRALAGRIAANPALAVQHIKNAIYFGQETTFDQLLQYVSLALGSLSKTEDHMEAISAFAEKRKPEFKGR